MITNQIKNSQGDDSLREPKIDDALEDSEVRNGN